MKYYLTLFTALLSFGLFSQVPISNGGQVDILCGSPINLTDSDPIGNYGQGEDFQIILCPDGGNAVFFRVSPNEDGHTWDVASIDFIFVYDGTDTSAPLLGVYNSSSHSDGFVVFSTLDNPTGCLTVVFQSAPSTFGGEGWTSEVGCGIQWQPFSIEIESIPESHPPDPGYIDICLGDEVEFTAEGDYPFSGTGYIQNDANAYYEWDMGEGTTYEGVGLNTVSQTYNDQFGYIITVSVTDSLGQIQTAEIKVRVSTTPNFSAILSNTNDTICFGNSATLVGGISEDTITTFGFNPTEGNFLGGGFFGQQLYLPDGSNDLYQTTINMDQFEPGQTITQGSDIVALCVNMEHSYLGDLEMLLGCPDGTNINVFNSFSGADEIIPGGFGGGGTFLGNALDQDQFNPGEGFLYCFRMDAEWGTLGEELALGNTVPVDLGNAMTPGDYQPEESFDSFIGCTINGPWTLTIQDNLFIDDGYIFSWSILFNADIDPTAESYLPQPVSYFWSDDPSITFQSDTLIVVSPPSPGVFPYTFNVIDDFGCSYDTTINLFVSDPIELVPGVGCMNQSEVQVVNSELGGSWTFTPPNDTAFANIFDGGGPNLYGINVNEAGTFMFTYFDLLCQQEHETEILFYPAPRPLLDDTIEYCNGDIVDLYAGDQDELLDVINPSYTWVYLDSSQVVANGQSVSLIDPSPGLYSLTIQTTDPCEQIANDLVQLIEENCELEFYNVFTPNQDGLNDFFTIQGAENFPNSFLTIYNRWGKVVYEKKNYRNNWNGDDLSEGVYFFVFSVSTAEKTEGYVHILR